MGNKSFIQDFLSTVLERVAEACKEAEVEFFIVGAYAQLLWLNDNHLAGRSTRDVDIAVYVKSEIEFERVKNYLIDRFGYHPLKNNPLRLIEGREYEIDLLPFNAESLFTVDRSIASVVGVDFDASGIAAVFPKGLRSAQIGDTSYRSASMPAIVLMKLIAIDERPELRTVKDLSDILLVLKHYYTFELEAVFEHHDDIYGFDLSEIGMGARIVGREVSSIVGDQPQINQRIPTILTNLLTKPTALAQAAAAAELDEVEALSGLAQLKIGLSERRAPM